jgi:hypothetical protein
MCFPSFVRLQRCSDRMYERRLRERERVSEAIFVEHAGAMESASYSVESVNVFANASVM